MDGSRFLNMGYTGPKFTWTRGVSSAYFKGDGDTVNFKKLGHRYMARTRHNKIIKKIIILKNIILKKQFR